MQRNKTPNSKPQRQESLIPNTHNNTQINFESTILCSFLSRRGWCIKEHNCNFKHPEQSKNSSSTYADKAPLGKQRETINVHRNKTLNSRLQTQQPPNTSMHNDAQINSKSTTPCPFLSRRGWCIKKNNCDFKHLEPLHLNEPLNNVPKHRVRCPFAYRRGYCLKGNQCDLSHDIPSTQSSVINMMAQHITFNKAIKLPNSKS